MFWGRFKATRRVNTAPVVLFGRPVPIPRVKMEFPGGTWVLSGATFPWFSDAHLVPVIDHAFTWFVYLSPGISA